MYIKANAKINISLNVLNKREDGYHNLDMINLPISLFDTIAVNRFLFGKHENKVLINDAEPTFANNICKNVIKFIVEKYHIDKKYEFAIYKDIPMEAGLGGGSSDAAAIFNFFNNKFDLKISNDEAIEMLKQFGADIPFFIINKPARVQGIGDIIKPIKIKKDYSVLIVKPQAGLSTKEIFKEIDGMVTKPFNIDKVVEALEVGDDVTLIREIGNSLEDVAIKKCSKIKEIKDYLIAKGLPITLMTGSGTAVFSLSTDKKLINDVACDLIKKNYIALIAEVIK